MEGETKQCKSHNNLEEQPFQTPGLLTPSPGHWPSPHKSRPEPRKATPYAGTVRTLRLAGSEWGALESPSPDTQSHTHNMGWRGILVENPRFTGSSEKRNSLLQPRTNIYLLNLCYLSLPRICPVPPKGPHSVWNSKTNMPHPFRA